MRFVWLGAAAMCLAGCGSASGPVAPSPMPAAAPTPAPPPIATPTGSGSAVGIWSGTGSDSFSPELVTLAISQSGSDLSGSAEIKPVNPNDGTCGSCHKVKTGTLTGTVSGNALTMKMTFPPGGNVPTPICATEFTATGLVAAGRLTGTYTGTDTCEGIYANGVLDLRQQ